MLVEGRHFLAGADAAQLGHKALAVNLSDLAAMGAAPANKRENLSDGSRGRLSFAARWRQPAKRQFKTEYEMTTRNGTDLRAAAAHIDAFSNAPLPAIRRFWPPRQS